MLVVLVSIIIILLLLTSCSVSINYYNISNDSSVVFTLGGWVCLLRGCVCVSGRWRRNTTRSGSGWQGQHGNAVGAAGDSLTCQCGAVGRVLGLLGASWRRDGEEALLVTRRGALHGRQPRKGNAPASTRSRRPRKSSY